MTTERPDPTEHPPPGEGFGPVPEDSTPGHHPAREQDQPDPDAFARRFGAGEPGDPTGSSGPARSTPPTGSPGPTARPAPSHQRPDRRAEAEPAPMGVTPLPDQGRPPWPLAGVALVAFGTGWFIRESADVVVRVITLPGRVAVEAVRSTRDLLDGHGDVTTRTAPDRPGRSHRAGAHRAR